MKITGYATLIPVEEKVNVSAISDVVKPLQSSPKIMKSVIATFSPIKKCETSLFYRTFRIFNCKKRDGITEETNVNDPPK